MRLDHCCLCGEREAGIEHVLARCPALQVHRAGLPQEVLPYHLAWVPMYANSLAELEVKARFFGLCMCTLISSLLR